MNVLLIAECTKNALTQTRRVLDPFAERRGARTWQTPITREGLATLHRVLHQTARKNTGVACHWIRGRDHSELLWIVVDADYAWVQHIDHHGAGSGTSRERITYRSGVA